MRRAQKKRERHTDAQKERKKECAQNAFPLFEINAQRNTLCHKKTPSEQKKNQTTNLASTFAHKSSSSSSSSWPKPNSAFPPPIYLCLRFLPLFLSIFFEIFALFAPFFSYSRCFFYRRLFVVRLGLLAEATFARKKMTPLARAFSPLVRVVVLKEGLPQKRPSPREEEKSPNKRE